MPALRGTGIRRGAPRAWTFDWRRRPSRVALRLDSRKGVPYADDVGDALEQAGIGRWSRLLRELPGVRLVRTWGRTSTRSLAALAAGTLPAAAPARAASARTSGRSRDLSLRFTIECPPGVNPWDVERLARKWPGVASAARVPPVSLPMAIGNGDPLLGEQLHLHAAPRGVDAVHAWTVPGGQADLRRLVDLELAWSLLHEDLAGVAPASPLVGVNQDPDAAGLSQAERSAWRLARSHGTSVPDIVAARQNAVGGRGIAPGALTLDVAAPVVDGVSSVGSSVSVDADVHAALGALVDVLAPGDVLLLELQGDVFVEGGSDEAIHLPLEADDAVFEIVQQLTAAGVHVVEPAGNGGESLDAADVGGVALHLDPDRADFRDSGALLVGASLPSTNILSGSALASGDGHARLAESNFGKRVDCFAWGLGVRAPVANANDPVAAYGEFTGTSAAAAILTGVLLDTLGMLAASPGSDMSPSAVRSLLRSPALGTGTLTADAAIGVMPDLSLVAHAALAPHLAKSRVLELISELRALRVALPRRLESWRGPLPEPGPWLRRPDIEREV